MYSTIRVRSRAITSASCGAPNRPANSACGLINTIGLLTKADLEQLPFAYQYYQTPLKKRDNPKFYQVHKLVQNALDTSRIPYIQFLGVWDTVGAHGAPFPSLQKISQLFQGFKSNDMMEISTAQLTGTTPMVGYRRRPVQFWRTLQRGVRPTVQTLYQASYTPPSAG